jgi:UDP-N-acetylmuramate dehydrogenase
LTDEKENFKLRGEMRYQERMDRHTSWRVGGPADNYYIPADINDLKAFLRTRPGTEKCVWVGLGSNLLVRDGGVRGTVISVTGVLNELSVNDPGILRIGAGVPGTFGGALAMNAGAFGGETWGIVKQAETIDLQGEIKVRTKAELSVEYRSVLLPENEWFIAGELNLLRSDPESVNKYMRELLVTRSKSQPTGELSCGSVFRNPEGDYAGRLVDACGLKGFRIGKACVSEKHGNFIVNQGGANARDIEDLIDHMQRVVFESFGVRLELEVRIVGENIE